MIRLALELPTSLLARFTPLTDLDFILAHRVLADTNYASFFQDRPIGRECILDNSMHELGHPLPAEDLVEAARRSRSTSIIAPDLLCTEQAHVTQNLAWLKETIRCSDRKYDIASTLYGLNREQRHDVEDFLRRRVDILCLPYREPRLDWFRHMKSPKTWKRIHLLGVSTLKELREWAHISNSWPHDSFSVDTTKAVKWGVQLKRIDDLHSLRGGSVTSADIEKQDKLTETQLQIIEHNIQVLRRACIGES